MRISIEVDAATLADVMKITGERKKSPALSRAVVEFVKRAKARQWGRLMREGTFDYGTTNEELESQSDPTPGA